jgi:hypothetical protein
MQVRSRLDNFLSQSAQFRSKHLLKWEVLKSPNSWDISMEKEEIQNFTYPAVTNNNAAFLLSYADLGASNNWASERCACGLC